MSIYIQFGYKNNYSPKEKEEAVINGKVQFIYQKKCS
jgi:hypothetical protein